MANATSHGGRQITKWRPPDNPRTIRLCGLRFFSFKKWHQWASVALNVECAKCERLTSSNNKMIMKVKDNNNVDYVRENGQETVDS